LQNSNKPPSIFEFVPGANQLRNDDPNLGGGVGGMGSKIGAGLSVRGENRPFFITTPTSEY
jgi:hypothetical protein